MCWPIRSSGCNPSIASGYWRIYCPGARAGWTQSPTVQYRVRDPDDQVFLHLALAAATPVLVSGDADLLALNDEVPSLQIINPADFQFWLVAHR